MTDPFVAPLIFVIGPRRSGTNFAEVLLTENLDCRIADLNRNPIRPEQARRPNLFTALGNKHDITAARLEAMLEAGGRILAQSRNPVDWLIARCRYQALIDTETAEAVIARQMHRWIAREYAGFWQTVLDVRDRGAEDRILVQRYEDVLTDPVAALKRVADRFGLTVWRTPPHVPDRELRPGGNMGLPYVVAPDPFNQYDRIAHADKHAAMRESLSAALAARLGYEIA